MLPQGQANLREAIRNGPAAEKNLFAVTAARVLECQRTTADMFG